MYFSTQSPDISRGRGVLRCWGGGLRPMSFNFFKNYTNQTKQIKVQEPWMASWDLSCTANISLFWMRRNIFKSVCIHLPFCSTRQITDVWYPEITLRSDFYLTLIQWQCFMINVYSTHTRGTVPACQGVLAETDVINDHVVTGSSIHARVDSTIVYFRFWGWTRLGSHCRYFLKKTPKV